MYITSTKSDKEADWNDPGIRQIFGERIDYFFTLGALTNHPPRQKIARKQTTLSLKKTVPLSTTRKFLQSSLMAISLTVWEVLVKQL